MSVKAAMKRYERHKSKARKQNQETINKQRLLDKSRKVLKKLKHRKIVGKWGNI